MPRLTSGAMRDLALWMGLFGLAVGAVFPVAVVALGVPAAEVLRPGFVLACLAAGLVVAAANFALARAVVGRRLGVLGDSMTSVRGHLAEASASGDVSGCDPETCKVPENSYDEFGAVAEAFNDLVDAVVAAHRVEQAIASTAARLVNAPGPRKMAEVALEATVAVTGAPAGLVVQRDAQGQRQVLARHGALPTGAAEQLTVPLVAGGSALATAELQERLHRQASVDDLTGLANRRVGLECLDGHLRRAAVSGDAIGVLLVDVDHFKAVNDTYGHHVGDQVLRPLADRMSQGPATGGHGVPLRR